MVKGVRILAVDGETWILASLIWKTGWMEPITYGQITYAEVHDRAKWKSSFFQSMLPNNGFSRKFKNLVRNVQLGD